MLRQHDHSCCITNVSGSTKKRRIRSAAARPRHGRLNVTLDSFSDGGKYLAISQRRRPRAADAGRRGRISSISAANPPGPAPSRSPAEEEMARVLPVIERSRRATRLRHFHRYLQGRGRRAPRSTAGAAIINDVTGLRGIPAMARGRARHGRGRRHHAHAGRRRATCRRRPHYENVVRGNPGIFFDNLLPVPSLRHRPRCTSPLIPGIGFGKTVAHNLAPAAEHLDALRVEGRPLAAGCLAQIIPRQGHRQRGDGGPLLADGRPHQLCARARRREYLSRPRRAGERARPCA